MRDFRAALKGLVLFVAIAAPSVAFADSIEYTAAVVVTQTSNSSVLGYVSTYSTPGYFGYTSTLGDALIVDFTLDGGATTASGVDLAFQDPSAVDGFGYLGLVQGRDDTTSTLQSGSFQYAYLNATNSTPAGSTPQTVGNYYSTETGDSRTSESAIWTVDVSTGELVPVWVNPDGSTPSLDLFTQSSALYAGGDMGAFNSRYPAPVSAISLSLDILSQTTISTTPEPGSLALLVTGMLCVGMIRFRSRWSAGGSR